MVGNQITVMHVQISNDDKINVIYTVYTEV